jgi:hypothetical protein
VDGRQAVEDILAAMAQRLDLSDETAPPTDS